MQSGRVQGNAEQYDFMGYTTVVIQQQFTPAPAPAPDPAPTPAPAPRPFSCACRMFLLLEGIPLFKITFFGEVRHET